jgi:hypothetical protein
VEVCVGVKVRVRVGVEVKVEVDPHATAICVSEKIVMGVLMSMFEASVAPLPSLSVRPLLGCGT